MVILVVVFGLDEGEDEGDKGGHLKDDEGHVLQGLPHQLQERLGRLGRDRVGPKRLPPVLQVRRRATQPCEGPPRVNASERQSPKAARILVCDKLCLPSRKFTSVAKSKIRQCNSYQLEHGNLYR